VRCGIIFLYVIVILIYTHNILSIYKQVSESERVELQRSLAREVRILRGVSSPFIVKLLGVQQVDLGGGVGGAGVGVKMGGGGGSGHAGSAAARGGGDHVGVCAVVYELCRLGSVEDAIQCKGCFKHRPISGTVRFEILVQASIGLLELHSRGILHLDFKPANVLLDGSVPEAKLSDAVARDLRVRIGDFGMARAVHQLKSNTSNTSKVTSTLRTTLWITEGYACPDYVATRKGTASTDVYAMGITMLRLVTGKQVTSASGRLQITVTRALQKQQPDIKSLCDDAAKWCPQVFVYIFCTSASTSYSVYLLY